MRVVMKKLSLPPAANQATTFLGNRKMLDKATKYLTMVLIKLRLLIEKKQRHFCAGGTPEKRKESHPDPPLSAPVKGEEIVVLPNGL